MCVDGIYFRKSVENYRLPKTIYKLYLMFFSNIPSKNIHNISIMQVQQVPGSARFGRKFDSDIYKTHDNGGR